MYLALDELDTVFEGRWCWSTRRMAPAWFRRADYLGPADQDLRDSVRELIVSEGGSFGNGRICLMTHPRYWGLGFNPVSFYYCFDQNNRLQYVVAEVTNTPWGQKHAYVLDAKQFDPLGCEMVPKSFHVSPFMTCDLNYQFRVGTPSESALVEIVSLQQEMRKFDVTMRLNRRTISAGNLARVLVCYPAMTLQVVGQIYIQALRLWWKGVSFVPHPTPGISHGNLSSKQRFASQRSSTGPDLDNDQLPPRPVPRSRDTVVSRQSF
jgi:DUF1365 family protein